MLTQKMKTTGFHKITHWTRWTYGCRVVALVLAVVKVLSVKENNK